MCDVFRFSFLLALLLAAGCGNAPPEPAVEMEESGAAEPVEVLSVGDVQAETPVEVPYLADDAPDDLYVVHQRQFGDLDEIAERRYLRFLVVYSKTQYFYDRGQPRGIAFEAGRELETFLNKKLKTGRMRLHVVFVPVKRERIIPDLEAGLGDLAAASLTITPSRQKIVDFSIPSNDNVSEVLVTGPASPEIASLDDLAGKEVHVRASSSYYEHLRSLSTSFRESGKQPIQVVAADERFEDEDILEMVNAGLLGATVVDDHKMQLWSQVFSDIKVHKNIAINTGGEIALAFRKDSPKLAAVINEFVKSRRAGTSFGNTLLRRYYRSTKWVRNATSSEEIAKFEVTLDLFKKYAGEYDFDWLMVAAQAYQESRLDNNARNPSGAVGIMQVLPSTAAGSPINIEDVHKLENNIHAGIKVLRHYRDQYFSDPGLDDENQTLMAFAGYNAGPNRINRLRKKAAEQGYDPNQWFDNVQRVVAKEVGREPVQYVANIYKYYIAYKLVMSQREK